MKRKDIAIFLAAVFAFLAMTIPAFADAAIPGGTERAVKIQVNVLKAVNDLRLTRDQVKDLSASLKDLKVEVDKLSSERLDLLNKEKDLLLAGKPVNDIEKNINLLGNDLKLKIESTANGIRKILSNEQYNKLIRNNNFGFLTVSKQPIFKGISSNTVKINPRRPAGIFEMRINGSPVISKIQGAVNGLSNFPKLSERLDVIITALDEKVNAMTV